MLNGKILNNNRNTVRGAIATKATSDHTQLYNKNEKNQHPIEAITGLTEALTKIEATLFDTNEQGLFGSLDLGLAESAKIVAVEGTIAKPTSLKGTYGYQCTIKTELNTEATINLVDTIDTRLNWQTYDTFQPETLNVANITISYFIYTYESKTYTVIRLDKVNKSGIPQCVSISDNIWWVAPLQYEIHNTNEVPPFKTSIANLDSRLTQIETNGVTWFKDTTQDDSIPTYIKTEGNSEAITFTKSNLTPTGESRMEYIAVVDHSGVAIEGFNSSTDLNAGDLVLAKNNKTISLQPDGTSIFNSAVQIKPANEALLPYTTLIDHENIVIENPNAATNLNAGGLKLSKDYNSITLQPNGISTFESNLRVEATPVHSLDVIRKIDFDTAISDEKQRAIAEELRLAESLDKTNKAFRTECDILFNALDIETSSRISADSDINSKLNAEISRSIQKDNELEANLNTSVASLTTTINTKITEEKQAREVNDSHILSELDRAKTDLNTAITAEINARNSADSELTEALNSEIITRREETAELETKLFDEASLARTKENELGQKITTEISDRAAADTAIYVAFNTEKEQREAADVALNESLIAKTSELTTNLAIEATERKTDVVNLTTTIETEQADRKAADQNLTTYIQLEEQRSKAEDTRLANVLDQTARSFQSSYNELSLALETETSNRISANNSLETDLHNEIVRATEKENELEQAFNTATQALHTAIDAHRAEEAQARIASITQLTSDFNTLKTSLKTDLNTEVQARLAQDQALQEQLAAEIADRTEITANLQLKLDDEITAARDKEAELNQKLLEESRSRSDADLALNIALNTEKAERQANDDLLSNTLMASTSELTTAIAREKVERNDAVNAEKAAREALAATTTSLTHRINVVETTLNDTTTGEGEDAETVKGLISRVDDLEAIDHGQLAQDASAAAVATILDGAPTKFDTLKEIAAWIAHEDTAENAASLVTRVDTLENNIGTSTDPGTSNTIYGAITAIDGRITSIENLLPTEDTPDSSPEVPPGSEPQKVLATTSYVDNAIQATFSYDEDTEMLVISFKK